MSAERSKEGQPASLPDASSARPLELTRRDLLWSGMDRKINQAMAMDEVLGTGRNWAKGLSTARREQLFELVVLNDVRRAEEAARPKPVEPEPDLLRELMDDLKIPVGRRADFRLDFMHVVLDLPDSNKMFSDKLEREFQTHPVLSGAAKISPEAADVAKIYVLEEVIGRVFRAIREDVTHDTAPQQ